MANKKAAKKRFKWSDAILDKARKDVELLTPKIGKGNAIKKVADKMKQSKSTLTQYLYNPSKSGAVASKPSRKANASKPTSPTTDGFLEEFKAKIRMEEREAIINKLRAFINSL